MKVENIMPIKKQFVDLVTLLENNKEKKVSSILTEVLKMVESKKRDTTVLYDADEKAVAIFCFYHKQWELVIETPYGSKASSASGLNTMCKVGVSKWTKQQSVAKNARIKILDDVANGDTDPSEINVLLAGVEIARNAISEDKKPKGYAEDHESIKTLKNLLNK